MLQLNLIVTTQQSALLICSDLHPQDHGFVYFKSILSAEIHRAYRGLLPRADRNLTSRKEFILNI